jgi:hypothetical protein
MPAHAGHVEGCASADPQRQAVAGSGIPAHAARATCRWKFTTNPNLEQPNDQGKCQDEHDRDLKQLFHFLSFAKVFSSQEINGYTSDMLLISLTRREARASDVRISTYFGRAARSVNE